MALKRASRRRGGRVCAFALAFAVAIARAQSTIPADIGVSLSVDPATNLATNQAIHVTISVTNYGPDPAPQVGVLSSTFTNEFGAFVTNPDECFLFVTVVDALPNEYYYINWDVANVLGIPGSLPLNPGETRTCHFQFALTSQAGSAVPFSIGLASFFTDINPSNDQATVLLQRPRVVVEAPFLSWPFLVALIIALTSCAVARVDRKSVRNSDEPVP